MKQNNVCEASSLADKQMYLMLQTGYYDREQVLWAGNALKVRYENKGNNLLLGNEILSGGGLSFSIP